MPKNLSKTSQKSGQNLIHTEIKKRMETYIREKSVQKANYGLALAGSWRAMNEQYFWAPLPYLNHCYTTVDRLCLVRIVLLWEEKLKTPILSSNPATVKAAEVEAGKATFKKTKCCTNDPKIPCSQ